MALIRMYVYDGTYYQTGLLDTSARAGQQCLNPDPQSFTSIEDLINYSVARGEYGLQETTLDQVNSLCSGALTGVPGMMQPGGAGGPCCLCQGGGARNFVPGAGNVPPNYGQAVMGPPQGPMLDLIQPQNTVAGRIIAKARRQPINTIIY